MGDSGGNWGAAAPTFLTQEGSSCFCLWGWKIFHKTLWKLLRLRLCPTLCPWRGNRLAMGCSSCSQPWHGTHSLCLPLWVPPALVTLSAVTSSPHRVLRHRGHCPAQPFPCQPLPIPARSEGHTGNPSQLPPASPGLKAALVWRATESLPSHIQPVGRAPAVPGKQ